MQYASENLIPVTLELGGKSPNVFFDDVASKQDEFYDKALEGFAMVALNQGEACTCPSRDQTPAPSPYRVSLAIFSASASSSNDASETTGPKISSWKIRIEFEPSKMVGCT